MSDYVLLYSGGRMPQGEAEQKAVMADWDTWLKTLGDRLVDQGNPFMPDIRNISSMGRVSNDTDGCRVSGYSIIKADSLDAAVNLAKGCPVLKGGADISVYETFNPMPDTMH